MKTTIALICFTEAGASCAERLKARLDRCYQLEAFVSSKFAGKTSLKKHHGTLAQWTEEWFPKANCLVFVGACGIAVRAIAPLVQDKFTDPAVVVIDERAQFCISLMSGHVGGANDLTKTFAQILQAQPVITTATDINSRFAVDVFAKRNNLWIGSRRLAKEISAAVLAGNTIFFHSDFPFSGAMPRDLTEQPDQQGLGVDVSFFSPIRKETLWLAPKKLVLGIGCRKGVSYQAIESFVLQTLREHRLSVESVAAVASIDLKAEEPGLLEFCAANHLQLVTYSAQELKQVRGAFSPSDFVQSVTGVDNVCERSAVLHSGGKLLVSKKKGNGVTLAAAANPDTIMLQF